MDYDQIYKALGNSTADRRKANQEYVFEMIPDDGLKLIRDSIQRNQVTSGKRIREQLEKKFKFDCQFVDLVGREGL